MIGTAPMETVGTGLGHGIAVACDFGSLQEDTVIGDLNTHRLYSTTSALQSPAWEDRRAGFAMMRKRVCRSAAGGEIGRKSGQ